MNPYRCCTPGPGRRPKTCWRLPVFEAGRRLAACDGAALNHRFLGEVLRRIVAVAEPDRIILFGSAARGQAGLDSNLDLLVVHAWRWAAAQWKCEAAGRPR